MMQSDRTWVYYGGRSMCSFIFRIKYLANCLGKTLSYWLGWSTHHCNRKLKTTIPRRNVYSDWFPFPILRMPIAMMFHDYALHIIADSLLVAFYNYTVCKLHRTGQYSKLIWMDLELYLNCTWHTCTNIATWYKHEPDDGCKIHKMARNVLHFAVSISTDPWQIIL